MGSVRRAPRSSQWEARYRSPDGRQRTKTFATKADARSWLSEVETDVRRGRYVDPAGARVLFGEWADRWRSTTTNLRPTTRARDESYYRTHIEPVFGSVPLGAIDHLAIREWVAGLTASGRAPATVQKAHQVLAKIMRAAVDAGLLATSPCERQPLPRVERDEMRFLTPADVARLADAIEPRYRALVLVGAYGGLRAGELFGLRRSRVDVLHATVDVAEVLTEVSGHHHFGPPKTRAGRRRVPRSCSRRLGARRCGRRCSGAVCGIQPSKPRGSFPYGCMTCATARWPCGSRPVRHRTRWRRAPATRPR
jgi:integrase